MKSYNSLLHVIYSAMLMNMYCNNNICVKVFISLKNGKILKIMKCNYYFAFLAIQLMENI